MTIHETIMKARAEALCGICGVAGARPYPAGRRCDEHAPSWPPMGPSGISVMGEVESPSEEHAPVMFERSHEVPPQTAPEGARALYRAAVAAGWSVAVTEACGGAWVSRMPVGPDGRRHKTLMPEVVTSFAVRCRKGSQRAVGIWWDGAANCGILLGPDMGSVGVTALLEYVRASSGTVTA